MTTREEQMTVCIPSLRRYARALVGNRSMAEDLVQDTLERGWSRLNSWQHGSDMRAWLFSIMHNLFVDTVRRQRMSTEAYDEDKEASDLSEPQMNRMLVMDLHTSLSKLPMEQREVLLLVSLEELSYEEVANTLSIPVGTVMSRLFRAREKLRFLMEVRESSNLLRMVK